MTTIKIVFLKFLSSFLSITSSTHALSSLFLLRYAHRIAHPEQGSFFWQRCVFALFSKSIRNGHGSLSASGLSQCAAFTAPPLAHCIVSCSYFTAFGDITPIHTLFDFCDFCNLYPPSICECANCGASFIPLVISKIQKEYVKRSVLGFIPNYYYNPQPLDCLCY